MLQVTLDKCTARPWEAAGKARRFRRGFKWGVNQDLSDMVEQSCWFQAAEQRKNAARGASSGKSGNVTGSAGAEE